jgi:hypothetical protein
MPHFRCVDSDKAYAPTIAQLDRIPVVDVTDLYPFIDPRGLALVGRGLAAGNGVLEPGGKEKGAQSKKAPDSDALLVWLCSDIRYENQPLP